MRYAWRREVLLAERRFLDVVRSGGVQVVNDAAGGESVGLMDRLLSSYTMESNEKHEPIPSTRKTIM